MFLKHRGCLDLPIKNICKFSRVALAAATPVSRSLLFFPPKHFSPDK